MKHPLFKNLRKSKKFRWFKFILSTVVIAHFIGIIFNHLSFKYEFWDDDKDRGGIAYESELFDESHDVPIYLDQGWQPEESLWFYNTNQGSNLLPYDFYFSLELAESKELFSSINNIDKYRFLYRKNTHSNPDSLPVGFAKDTYKGKEYLGFTCAACHTSQINYTNQNTNKTTAIRIDGGPSQADFEKFMKDLEIALSTTNNDKNKRADFIKRVKKRNYFSERKFKSKNYSSDDEIIADLEIYARRFNTYNLINQNYNLKYGYSRLDAFGRIYNRVLEHIIDLPTLEKILKEFLEEARFVEVINKIKNEKNDSLKLVEKTLKYLTIGEKNDFLKKVFNDADAPVSYPYIWDAPYHDYVQWNGIVNNSGPGALGRNVGQVIGVFGTLDWKKEDSFGPSDILVEKKSVINDIDFHSSISIRKLVRTEQLIRKLKSPKWPEKVLGHIDKEKSKAGRELFIQYCQSCHADINRNDEKRRITSHFTKLDEIGTDPKMALQSIAKKGFSGFLKGSYASYPAGTILIQEKAPVTMMVRAATENSIKTADIDTSILARWSDWIYDLFFVYFDNPVENTIKHGSYNPDTTANPFASLESYKARPLNGIWATAPYLHNGSVPTLYHLLLPAKDRPKTFMVGSREFDKKHIGFKFTKNGLSTLLDTALYGNSNSGHEYGTDDLSYDQRLELIEYLKTL